MENIYRSILIADNGYILRSSACHLQKIEGTASFIFGKSMRVT